MKRPHKRPVSAPARAGGGITPGAQAGWNWWLGIFLLAASLVAYWPALHGGFIWDDAEYVAKNQLLTAPDGLRRIWFSLDSPSQYFPLVYTTFRLEYALWGLRAEGYHWVNLLLHTANALLVWRLLGRLAVPGAWFAAALFALHPVQVESVAWITERKNVLMGFFFLLTLLVWVEFVKDQARPRWRLYALALTLYAVALSSKTTACTLPAALLLILWLKRIPVDRRRLAQMFPFVVLGIGMGLVAVWWERYHQGTHGKGFEMGLVERMLVASRAVWFYAGKLLWPASLSFSYPRWTILPSDLLAYGWLLAGAALGAAVCFARNRVGRSVEVALLFFVATLGPMLGFIMLYTFRYSFVADHYQYLACLGPIALFSAALMRLPGLLKWQRRWPMAVFCGGMLIVLGALTWRQCGMYADMETLWRTTIARNPDSWMARNNLGLLLAAQGKFSEAIPHYQQAIQLQPGFAETYNNLGLSLVAQGKISEATQRYEQALRLDPDYADAHNNLGNLLKSADAISHYDRALQLKPDFPEAHNNLAVELATQGKLEAAIQHYERALQLNPDYAEAHNNFAAALTAQGKLKEAIQHCHLALQLKPDFAEACYNLGDVLTKQGKLSEAIPHFQQAWKLATEQGNAGLAETVLNKIKSYQQALSPTQTR